jgi:hypothetical protein
MKKTFRILTLLLLLTVAAACNTSDDVTEIFNGHRFKITGITYNGIKTTKEAEELYTDNGTYYITFNAQTIQGMLADGTPVDGTWKAEGKGRKMVISLRRPQSADGMSEVCRLIYLTLKDATSYGGDRNVLRIYRDSNTYIDLSSK